MPVLDSDGGPGRCYRHPGPGRRLPQDRPQPEAGRRPQYLTSPFTLPPTPTPHTPVTVTPPNTPSHTSHRPRPLLQPSPTSLSTHYDSYHVAIPIVAGAIPQGFLVTGPPLGPGGTGAYIHATLAVTPTLHTIHTPLTRPLTPHSCPPYGPYTSPTRLSGSPQAETGTCVSALTQKTPSEPPRWSGRTSRSTTGSIAPLPDPSHSLPSTRPPSWSERCHASHRSRCHASHRSPASRRPSLRLFSTS
jgi:hypothetical protein